MKVGIVCPYSLDRPGGVQLHVTNLAAALMDLGHEVRVLAPSSPNTPVPGFIDSTGRALALSYNGSTARVIFGIVAAFRVRAWLRRGNFDIVHLHEPGAPSLSLLAMWARVGPTVATFHTANDSSIVMKLAKPFIKPGMEVLDARIAVSPSADRTIKEHLRLEATHIIPNGVSTKAFVAAPPRAGWQGTQERPTIGILGRMDEPRKGLGDFLDSIPFVREEFPKARFLVAGRYSTRTKARIVAAGAEPVGGLDESLKQRFMSSVDVYCAPNTGGESFGIVVVEAMAAGAAVVASELDAFRDVAMAEGGEPCLALHRVGDPEDLGLTIRRLLRDPASRKALAKRSQRCGGLFDWDSVAPRVAETYREAIRMYAEH